MKFTKMHGLGNDFVVLEQQPKVSGDLVRRLCDRRLGVGADGLLTADPTADGSVLMGYWNADGSPAEMCGNGLRCVARYAHDHGWVTGESFTVITPAGPRRVTVHSNDTVTAEIGDPHIEEPATYGDLTGVGVSVGNPHFVVPVVDVEAAPVAAEGPRLEAALGANVEFVENTGTGIRVRTWERGVGETMACGSGAVAAAAVAHREFGLPGHLEVHLLGGVLTVDLFASPVTITGPATYVFEGTFADAQEPVLGS